MVGNGAAIDVRDLVKEYEGGLVRALKGVTFSVERGEFVTIMGPSGGGKSTLLHCVGALDVPTSGEVLIVGKDVARAANLDRLRLETIGFVFQLHNLIPNLSLAENVALPMVPRRVPRKEALKRACDLLERVGLGHRTSFLPVKVSGGERQRAAIARALVNDPDILLADEPTGNVDTETGRRIMALLLAENRERGVTIVVITHNEEIGRSGDRLIRLVDGSIVSVERGARAAEPAEAASALQGAGAARAPAS